MKLKGVGVIVSFRSLLTAIIAGLIVQFVIRRFDDKYFQPIREYKIIRRKIISALTVYIPEYSRPHYLPLGGPINAQHHTAASTALRELASEFGAIIAAFYIPDVSIRGLFSYLERVRKMIVAIIYRDIPEQTILKNIQRNLIGLSNSLFLAVGQKNDDNGGKVQC